jgi:Tfp pilus assembly protein PilO
VAAKEMGEKQIFGITIGAFAAVLLILGTLVYFSSSKLSTLNRDTDKFEAQRKEAQLVADTLEKRKKEKKETEERVAECSQYLPKEDEIERTLLSMSGTCTEAQLESTTLKIDTSATATRAGGPKIPYDTIRYRGEFEGTFHQLAKFVSAIENWKTFKRFVNITAFSMEASAKGLGFDDGTQKHKIKMTLELYKYPEPAPTPAPGGPGARPGLPATPAEPGR